ncbi:MAG: AI-2E family transporter [Actinomycetota bacterium]
MASRDVIRITLTVAGTLMVLWVLWLVREVLLLIGVAAFLALAMEPAVTFFQRFVKSRGLAVAGVVVLILAFLTLFFAAIGPPIVAQTDRLIDNLPELGEDLRDDSTLLGRLERQFDLTERLQDAAGKVSQAVARVPSFVGTVFGLVADFLVVMVLTIYFLLNAPEIKKGGIKLLPPGKQKKTAEVSDLVFAKVGGWMEGVLLIAFIAGVISFVVLAVLGVPYPAALAMWVAIADMIPMVGAMLGAVVCITVAFFTGAVPGVVATIFFLIYQQVENYVIAPRVMKRSVDVSAAAVIIAVLVGGTLLGPIGVLLAVPAAASLKVIAQQTWLNKQSA